MSQRLKNTFIDLFKDSSDLDELNTHLSMFEMCIRAIQDRNTRSAFEEGFTSMFLSGNEMNAVEDFFKNLRNNPGSTDKIEIVITENSQVYDTVPMDYIQFWSNKGIPGDNSNDHISITHHSNAPRPKRIEIKLAGTWTRL